MPDFHKSKLFRIGVFYDGNFFFHVSNYYKYSHPRRARICISGLHKFIINEVSRREGIDPLFCHIIDAHFFRGRYSAKAAEEKQTLFNDRVVDDILMGEGVITHYLPIRGKSEKGIDVWLALEAFELAVFKKFDVLVLIAGDGDFVPLVRKLNSLGTRVMVLAWDFRYTDSLQNERETVTSMHLLSECTYPMRMNQVIDDPARRNESIVNGLFMSNGHAEKPALPNMLQQQGTSGSACVSGQESALDEAELSSLDSADSESCISGSLSETVSEPVIMEGEIISIKEGYGFIRCPAYTNNVFLHWSKIENCEFQDLQIGDVVQFQVTEGERGPIAIHVFVQKIAMESAP